MNERGLSTVVVTVIMVLIVLVAIGVVWITIRNILTGTTEDIELKGSQVSLVLHSVLVEPGILKIQVERKVGAGNIDGLRFIISGGSKIVTIDDLSVLDELESSTYIIPYDGIVKEISVVPILKSETGKTGVGTESPVKEFSEKDMIKNMGAVSWWKFEDSSDEIGGNTLLTYYGNVSCEVKGKFGKGCLFDGSGDGIEVKNGQNLNITGSELGIFAWVNYNGVDTSYIFNNYNYIGNPAGVFGGYAFKVNFDNRLRGIFWEGPSSINDLYSTNSISNGQWNHVGMVFNGTRMTFYQNGIEDNHIDFAQTTIIGGSYSPHIGVMSYDAPNTFSFDGKIDEVMVFDRALSPEQVNDLYKYNFGD